MRHAQYLFELFFVGFVSGIRSRNFLAVSCENGNAVAGRSVNHSPCDVEQWRCGDLNSGNSSCSTSTVEPRTGIEFPTILDNIFGGAKTSLNTEVHCCFFILLFIYNTL